MKLKKRYIIILLLIITITFVGFIFKQKNIQISNIFNKNDKLASLTFQSKGECDQWINPSSISSSDIIYSGSNYTVIYAKNTNLKTDEGNTGYEGIAFINSSGCAVKISDVTSPNNNNTDLCNSLKQYVYQKDNLSHWADIYNSFISNDKSGQYCHDKITVVPKETETDPAKECINKKGEYINPDSASKIALFDEIKNGSRYQIINANSTDLEGTGYEGFAFLIDGCTSPLEDTVYGSGFASRYGNATNPCTAMRNYITNNRPKEENPWNYNYWANHYNNDYINGHGNLCRNKIDTIDIDVSTEKDKVVLKWNNEGWISLKPSSHNDWEYDNYADAINDNGGSCIFGGLNLKNYIFFNENNGNEKALIYNELCPDKIDTNTKTCSEKTELCDSYGECRDVWYYGGIVSTTDCSGWNSEPENDNLVLKWNEYGYVGLYDKNWGYDYKTAINKNGGSCIFGGLNLKNYIFFDANGGYEHAKIYNELCPDKIDYNTNTCSEKTKLCDSEGTCKDVWYFNGLVTTEDCSGWNQNHSCSYFLEHAEEGWVAPKWAYDGYIDISYTTENWARYWLSNTADNCGCNPNLKYFVKSTSVKNVLAEVCGEDAVLNEIGYHTHTAIDSFGVSNTNCYRNGIFIKEGTCDMECTQETRNQIISANNVSQAQVFNSSCTNLEKINMKTITLDWQDGWGPSELNGAIWDGGNGVYNISSISNSVTITFDNPLVYYNKNLIGWSTSPACTTYTNASGLTHTFDSSTPTTYYACYEGDIYEGELFNPDGSKKTGETSDTYEKNECNDAETTNNNLTTVPMYLTSRYTNSSYNTITTSNPYCNVLCTDTVDIKYPNIFETVPAGQYFELMYEPEMTASRVCQSEFNYDKWKREYEVAISDELSKLSLLEQAKASYAAAVALNPTSDGSCNCQTCGTAPNTYSCNCKTYYSDSKTKNYYDVNGNHLSETQTFGACNSTNTSSIVSSAQINLNTAKTNYENAVKRRIKFEQYNLSCYTILDSTISNNIDIKYDEVFTDNYQTINELEPTYKVKASKVKVSEDSYGTSESYINYITNNTSITSTNLKHLDINAGKSTKDFYAVYPKLQFTYEVGIPEGYNSATIEKTITDVLATESIVKEDTASYTTINNNVYTKDNTTTNFSRSFNVEGRTQQYINFNAYFSHNQKTTYRTVKYYYIFHEGTEFYSSLQSGAYSKNYLSGKNVSLSKQTNYTKKDGSSLESSVKNNVYPVSLLAVNGIYDVSFNLSDKTGNYLKNKFDLKDTEQDYTCSYEITNDALTISKEQLQTYKNLKSNTIFRSVATNKLDPNNRSDTGKLGENWLNKKGLAAMKQIQEDEGVNEKNTYNPANLEYSFTLTPTLIQAIKDYNKTTNYDDFNLTCATVDGRECTSEFLTNLSQGVVKKSNTIFGSQNNYSTINPLSATKLTEARKTWKYYNGITIQEMALRMRTGSTKAQAMSLEEYLENYSKWGVLP